MLDEPLRGIDPLWRVNIIQIIKEYEKEGKTVIVASHILPEIEAMIIQNTMDQHYRQCLDEAIPALDNKTPRQCVRSKKGRDKVIEWLKHLENNELRRAASQGQEPYDSRWMWDELKLDKYRDC